MTCRLFIFANLETENTYLKINQSLREKTEKCIVNETQIQLDTIKSTNKPKTFPF